MFVASYLQISRHRVYYFRIVIPVALRVHFPSTQREIKKSLHTCDRAIAFARARLLHVKIDALFLQLQRDSMANPQPIVPMAYDLDFDPVTGRVVKVKDVRPGEAEEMWKVVAELNGSAAPTPPVACPSPPASDKMHKLASAVLSDIVDKYLIQYKPTVDISTYERRRGHLGVFVEYFGNCKISDIGRAKLSDYWEDLAFLPPQKDVRPDFKDQKLDRVLEKQKKLAKENMPYKGLSKQTQAHYREAVSGFYNWSVEKEIVDENIAARKTKRTKTYAAEMENEPREPYTPQDLKRIFEHDFFRQTQHQHPYQYWIPHIALFTGARINEIAQLYLDDIDQFEGYWAFHFCAITGDVDDGSTNVRRPDMRRKTGASARLTPIHPKLIELGLLAFRDSVRAEKHQRLFPELPYSTKGGYGTRASRWYMEEFLRPKVGITNPSKVFHSFRHTVITELGNTLFNMPEGKMVRDKDMITKAIVGHKMQGITFGHYLKQFHPKITSVVLNPLAWDVELTPYAPIKRKRMPVKRKEKVSPMKIVKERIASEASKDGAEANIVTIKVQLPDYLA